MLTWTRSRGRTNDKLKSDASVPRRRPCFAHSRECARILAAGGELVVVVMDSFAGRVLTLTRSRGRTDDKLKSDASVPRRRPRYEANLATLY